MLRRLSGSQAERPTSRHRALQSVPSGRSLSLPLLCSRSFSDDEGHTYMYWYTYSSRSLGWHIRELHTHLACPGDAVLAESSLYFLSLSLKFRPR